MGIEGLFVNEIVQPFFLLNVLSQINGLCPNPTKSTSLWTRTSRPPSSCATSFSSQVAPSSQHHCGREHQGHHHPVQPVSLPRWAHPVNIIVDENIKATIVLCNQFLFTGGPIQSTSLWTRTSRPPSSCASSFSSQEGGVLNSRPPCFSAGPTPRGGHGGVLYSARRGLRTAEARENWEERKGKK